MAEKIKLSKKDRLSVAWRHQFLQGSWNYERMQNGGWCYSIIPAIKKLYSNKDDQIAALKRHMEFYNTHPYVSAPVMGVTLALEEERANGAKINDQAIQGVKVGMMGPLAGVGDPVFWFTLRPILGALGASLHGILSEWHLSGIHKNLGIKLVHQLLKIYQVVYLVKLLKELQF